MAYTTVYSNPAQVAAPNLYKALKAAIASYAFPLLPSDSIRRGLQTGVSLPESDEVCVMYFHDRRRIGTNLKQYQQPQSTDIENGTLTELTLWEVTAQVSFFSAAYLAEQRGESFKTFVRGSMGAAFFRQYGIGSAYCDDLRVLDTVDGQKKQIQHCLLNVHLQYWSGITAQLPFTNGANVILRPLY